MLILTVHLKSQTERDLGIKKKGGGEDLKERLTLKSKAGWALERGKGRQTHQHPDAIAETPGCEAFLNLTQVIWSDGVNLTELGLLQQDNNDCHSVLLGEGNM